MKIFSSFFFIAILISSVIFTKSIYAADARITYTVSMPFPPNHLFEVAILVEDYSSGPDDFVDFVLPAWRTGRYVILNSSSGVQEFSAEDGVGNKLEWTKTDKDTWRISKSGSNSYKVKYKVFANEFSIRTRGLNDEQAFIDATVVLMYSEKLRSKPLELKIIPYDSWTVTTGLDKASGSENTFLAPDYDYLADCPLVIGNQKNYDFFIKGKTFTVSFPEDVTYNSDLVVNDIEKDFKCSL